MPQKINLKESPRIAVESHSDFGLELNSLDSEGNLKLILDQKFNKILINPSFALKELMIEPVHNITLVKESPISIKLNQDKKTKDLEYFLNNLDYMGTY